jgi:hypothetical protein
MQLLWRKKKKIKMRVDLFDLVQVHSANIRPCELHFGWLFLFEKEKIE